MNRLSFLALLALASGGCARSDLGERAASQVVKSAVAEEAGKVESSVAKIRNASMEKGKLFGFDAKGNKLWELSAKLIVTKEAGEGVGSNPRRATLTGAIVRLYREGKLESTFNAPLVEFFDNDKGLRMAMTQGIQASNAGAGGKDGAPIAISAKRGDVDVSKRLVSLSGDARVVRGPIVVTGKTLKTQTDLARSSLSGDVVAVSPQGETRAKTATFAWKADNLAATDVTFTQPGLTLTGAKLIADTAAEKGRLSGDVRAVMPDGKANAPAVDFDWKADSIRAARANITRDGAQMESGPLQTDSQLKVARAQSVTIRKDGATLQAASASGFDGLSRLSGTRVKVVRDGTTLTAARAQADDWSAQSGSIQGSGDVTATNARGKMTAQSANWSGGENGTIRAQGGVTIVSDGTTIKSARAQSDAKFQSATLNGDVRATLDDGSTLRAPQVSKSGAKIVATGGTTAQFVTDGALGLLTVKAPRIETTIQGQSATASGGVNLKSASGTTATAPTATYNRAAKTVVASGPVTYKDPASGEISGSSLRANLGLQSATIQNARGQSSGNVFEGKGVFD